MPTNNTIQDLAEDPYTHSENEGPSAYERAEQENQAREAREAALGQRVDLHRSEVEEACRIRSKRAQIEAQRDRFENDPVYRRRVETARRALKISFFCVGISILIFFADLFLGTPDLAEDLAFPVMSLIPDTLLPDADSVEAGSAATPNWLRLAIGIILSVVVLALTIAVKIIGDEAPVHNARKRLSAGDTRGWRLTTRQLWTRRAVKVGYLAIMFGAFTWLYTYAQERARVMESLTAGSVEEMDWQNLGFNLLSTGEGEIDESIPAANKESGESDTAVSGKLALGAGATYAMLFILHALLLMLPTPNSTIDLPLARFNPHRAEAKAAKMRRQEEGLLRGIVARIQTVRGDDSTRETLIVLSEPVARAVNELYGRTLMPIPETTDAEGANVETIHANPVDSSFSEPEVNGDETFAYDTDEEDPAQAIFGKSA